MTSCSGFEADELHDIHSFKEDALKYASIWKLSSSFLQYGYGSYIICPHDQIFITWKLKKVNSLILKSPIK